MDDSCRTSQKSGQTREDVEKGLRDPKIDGNNTVYLPAGRPTSPVNRISTETTKDIQGATRPHAGVPPPPPPRPPPPPPQPDIA
ncbi:sulfated surface glycoprotein 185-like [Pomacea canaliculata]|uniref:sulfated surface glycoprotein 185-like n=1 Tax=Pomacea canaliculata TaxID=400727 RepID=UPI000D7284C9|nr:sulfated surface glycoprotein 185-like [Pomacea canaliculata]